jgi:hypothetical protein
MCAGIPPTGEYLYRQAITIKEKLLGPEHPDMTSKLNILNVLFKEQDHYREIAAMYCRAQAI